MSFSAIKGQEGPIKVLKEDIKNSCLAGSYLFSGAAGTGKNLLAQTFAKAVNCLKGGPDSCDSCSSCLRMDKLQHPDLHIIDSGSSEIKIEYIRQLKDQINLRPYEARKKVFIIKNAHNLNTASANALLKTLEEPALNSLIILLSEKPGVLLKTVISRCRLIKLHPLKRQKLEEVLQKEYHLDQGLAHYLAYFCEGRLGHALALKDTEILRDKNKVIDEYALSGNSDMESLLNKDNLRDYLNILAGWFRDIYMAKIGIPYEQLINLDRKNELLNFMPRFSFSELDEIMDFITDSFFYLDHNVNVKLLQSNLREAITYGVRRMT